MSNELAPPASSADNPSATAAAAPEAAPTQRAPASPWRIWVMLLLAALVVAALAVAWSAQRRLRQVEQELVQRQQLSQDAATEARTLSRQAQQAATEAAARAALLEARVSEATLQRSQVEELIQSFSRSRDENVLADLEAALRVAQQQEGITGSAEPLVAALKQADERLARLNQPRLERVRRAIARDLDAILAAQRADVPALAVRIDELIREVDAWPLVTAPVRLTRQAAARAPAASQPASSQAAAGSATAPDWWLHLRRAVARWAHAVWSEALALVRVSHIDRPEAALTSPEQGFFLRENLKLRLLNARLALLSRQFDLASADLEQARVLAQRYFQPRQRRVAAGIETLGTLAQQSRQGTPVRPDETLASLAALAAKP